MFFWHKYQVLSQLGRAYIRAFSDPNDHLKVASLKILVFDEFSAVLLSVWSESILGIMVANVPSFLTFFYIFPSLQVLLFLLVLILILGTFFLSYGSQCTIFPRVLLYLSLIVVTAVFASYFGYFLFESTLWSFVDEKNEVVHNNYTITFTYGMMRIWKNYEAVGSINGSMEICVGLQSASRQV